ncbi:MAG: MYXO-CTERM sorting domain-containing protein, partial [Myxococcota bacterium]
SRLLAFLTTDSDCVFAQESDIDAPINSEQLINTSDPLVTNEAFNFPADFGNNDYNNVADILEASGACATPVDQSQQRLCFVASSNDDIAESGEPYAAVLLLIDTVPPDPPSSLEVLPRDGSIEVNIDTDEAAILSWSIRFRPEVGDEASCDTWGDEATTRERVIATQFDQSFTESVENGVTYEVCVFAQDEAGNTGDVSDTVVVTPQDECDFIECFPGDFDDGCSASGGSLATLLALLALVRRRRKEVRS